MWHLRGAGARRVTLRLGRRAHCGHVAPGNNRRSNHRNHTSVYSVVNTIILPLPCVEASAVRVMPSPLLHRVTLPFFHRGTPAQSGSAQLSVLLRGCSSPTNGFNVAVSLCPQAAIMCRGLVPVASASTPGPSNISVLATSVPVQRRKHLLRPQLDGVGIDTVHTYSIIMSSTSPYSGWHLQHICSRKHADLEGSRPSAALHTISAAQHPYRLHLPIA